MNLLLRRVCDRGNGKTDYVRMKEDVLNGVRHLERSLQRPGSSLLNAVIWLYSEQRLRKSFTFLLFDIEGGGVYDAGGFE